ncbi:MAG TPA: hypothetical protein VMX17_10235 [Candidatus Glassbacteria bacterium]|nr:hypothetical protein [Candidatus Glassbacteria bacterium]
MKLLNIWNQFNQSAKIVLSVLALLLILSVVHSFSSERKIDQWRQDYEEFRQSAEVTTQVAESLRTLADSALAEANFSDLMSAYLSDMIDRQKAEIDSIKKMKDSIVVRNDSTFENLTGGETNVENVVSSEPPQAEPWIRLSFSFWEQIAIMQEETELLGNQIDSLVVRDSLRLRTISLLQTSLSLQTQRGDSLQTIVLKIPPAPPTEKFLGIISLPSRKTSLIIGAVGGTLSFMALDSWLGNN